MLAVAISNCFASHNDDCQGFPHYCRCAVAVHGCECRVEVLLGYCAIVCVSIVGERCLFTDDDAPSDFLFSFAPEMLLREFRNKLFEVRFFDTVATVVLADSDDVVHQNF